MSVVWNGTMDKLGECESITGYVGGSSLNNAPPDSTFTGDELYQLQGALGVKSRQPKGSAREMARRVRNTAHRWRLQDRGEI